MTNVLIGNFIESDKRKNKVVRIQFKKRDAINGLFLVGADYEEMKEKNFWRIVTASREEEWNNTQSLSCSRLFSGDEFTKLTDL